MHAVQVPASMRHWNEATPAPVPSLPANAKAPVVDAALAGGCEVNDVSGAVVSTSQE